MTQQTLTTSTVNVDVLAAIAALQEQIEHLTTAVEAQQRALDAIARGRRQGDR